MAWSRDLAHCRVTTVHPSFLPSSIFPSPLPPPPPHSQPREEADRAVLGHPDPQCGGPGQNISEESSTLRGSGRPQAHLDGGWTGAGKTVVVIVVDVVIDVVIVIVVDVVIVFVDVFTALPSSNTTHATMLICSGHSERNSLAHFAVL